jgi:acyl-CoA reductase-like NAD-dependent aldehyde dehydrogenase
MESRSPTTGAVLGTVAEATAEDVRAARAAAALVQPLWAAVPPGARARYLRRAAQAVLDEVDELAGLLARETGRPRTEALLAELLPSVSGLHALADEGPGALADRRLGRPAILRGGRRAVLVQAPAGVVGVRTRSASPWAEPLLETAASLMAGNAVLLAPSAPLTGERIAAAFLRAGVPGELVAVLHGPAADALPEQVDAGGDEAKATMLVLGGAPLDAVVTGALWAAFAGAGRHPAAVGRLVVEAGSAGPLLEQLVAGARRLRLGDPEHADTEVGPLASQADLDAVAALVADAEAGGAQRLCGGPAAVPGVGGAFCAPVVLRGVAAGARLLREPPPGPVLAVLEVDSEADAIALARAGAEGPDTAGDRARGESIAGGAVSVWAGDRAHGERVARGLGADLAWVNEHGHAVPSVPVRLARHVRPRRLASQPSRLRSARWLPYDPSLVRARTAVARLLHGRQSERVAALREGALPLTRTALRVARDAAQPAKRSGSSGDAPR